MRDEEKSREELLKEIQLLRRQLETTGERSGRPAVGSGPARVDGSSDHEPVTTASELAFDMAEGNLPVLDEVDACQEEPKFLKCRPCSEEVPLIKESGTGQVTETGSFDLTWLTRDSFGKLLHAIPIPIVLVDSSGTMSFANHGFLALRDPSKPVAGDCFYAFFPDTADSRHAQTLVEKVFTERKPQIKEGALSIDNRALWSRIHMRSIRFGNERAALLLIEDLTAEKRELTLNEKYAKLVNIFPIGIAEFSLEREVSCNLPEEEMVELVLRSRVTDGNILFARLHGYDCSDSMRGVPLKNILSKDRIALDFYCTWIQNSCLVSCFETKEQGTSNEIRYFENTLVGNVQDGLIRQFWAMKQDITDRKRVQEELLEKIRTIDELYAHIIQSGKAKAIAEHTATVAHELRQPLAIIGGFARRMAKAGTSPGLVDAESLDETFSIIIKEVGRLEKILGGLIDFTKREAVSLQRINPNDLIDYVLRINEGRIKEKNLEVHCNLGSEVGEFLVDPDRFQQVVRNLVANAVEASPPNEAIRVETGIYIPSDKAQRTGELVSESYFEVKIINKGSVIPAEFLDKIFSPFFTTKDYGTGLGLTLSKKIVEDHKGSISVKSDEKGTQLTVWLPVRD